MIFFRTPFALCLLALAAAGCHSPAAHEKTPAAAPSSPPVMLRMPRETRVHDPAIAREGETYYVFCTGGRQRQHCVPIYTSKDLKNWTRAGAVFDQLPGWAGRELPAAQGVWAPDISFFNGRWHLYYALSSFGVNDSAIALATNKTLNPASPDYRWVDEGIVLRSRPGRDDFNAIDPNIAVVGPGEVWLSWGSFWGGIMLRRIDPATGKLTEKYPKMFNIAARPRAGKPLTPPREGAVEAPFIFKKGDYYYLFVSRDFCCRGPESDYKVAAGRSRAITGPYLDKNGVDLTHDGGTRIVDTSGDPLWYGAGHEAVFSDGGVDYLVFHAYPALDGGAWLRISTIAWRDGWPEAARLD